MSCENIPSLLDLQNTKKHVDDLGRLMGTGEGDSTNEVTGQVRPTYNKVMKSVGFKPGSGDFTTGFTVMPGERDIVWYDPVSKNWYSYLGVIPSPSGHPVAPGTNPVGNANWKPVTDQLLRSDLASVNGAGLVGTTSGATVQVELDDINGTMYQDPLTKWADGGTLKIKQGEYNITSSLVMDYGLFPSKFIGTPGVRTHYEGENMAETIFNCNLSTFAMQMKGDNTYTSQRVHAYDYLGGFTLKGSASSFGLLVQGKAYTKLSNITSLDHTGGDAIRVQNVITSHLEDIYAQTSNIGIRLMDSENNGDTNALTMNRITASNNKQWGIYGERWGASNVINGLTCEGNGTMGSSNAGGVLLNLAGNFACPALVLNAPYFELNKGGADLAITNTSATKPMTVIINGGLFNRGSPTEYTTTNIAVNSAGGATKVILIGVVFANSAGYIPSDSRPYWILGNNCSIIDIGCDFDNSTGKTTSASAESMVKSGRVNANGSVGTGVGFTVNKIATGVYDVVSTHGAFSTTNDGYMAIVQPYNALGTFCTNVGILSASAFRVTISGSNTGVGTDVAFNFVVAKVL